MSGHLSNDELIDRLYQIAADDSHLANCPDCTRRFAEMQRVKAQAIEPAPVSYDFLAAQRRAIYSRLGEDPSARMRSRLAWAPALAAVALVALGLTAHRTPVRSTSTASHGNPASQSEMSADDAQLFADVYSMEQSLEPSVAAPIHHLFEENQ